jgi:hypothetical protein
MLIPQIEGAWRSEGGLIYIITQIKERFMWRVVHKNGVVETGIGLLKNKKWNVKWNFHGGDITAGMKEATERSNDDDNRIMWDDHDHFTRIPVNGVL